MSSVRTFKELGVSVLCSLPSPGNLTNPAFCFPLPSQALGICLQTFSPS